MPSIPAQAEVLSYSTKLNKVVLKKVSSTDLNSSTMLKQGYRNIKKGLANVVGVFIREWWE